MHLFQLLTGSAFKNKGVQPLLRCSCKLFTKSKLILVQSMGTKLGSEDEMKKWNLKIWVNLFQHLAFKVANDPFVGSLTFIRIYSGTIKTGTAVYEFI